MRTVRRSRLIGPVVIGPGCVRRGLDDRSRRLARGRLHGHRQHDPRLDRDAGMLDQRRRRAGGLDPRAQRRGAPRAAAGMPHRLVVGRPERASRSTDRARASDRRPPGRRPPTHRASACTPTRSCATCRPRCPTTGLAAWYLDVRGIGRRGRAGSPAWRRTCPSTPRGSPRGCSGRCRRGSACRGWSGSPARPSCSSRRTSCRRRRDRAASCWSCTTWPSRRCPRPRRITTPGGGAPSGGGCDAASAVIVPSDATRDELFAHHGVDPSKVTVVLHGTDADAFSPVPPQEVEAVRRSVRDPRSLHRVPRRARAAEEPRAAGPGVRAARARPTCRS